MCVALTHHCPAKTRISIDARVFFFIFDFPYILSVRKIVTRFVYNDTFNVVLTEAVNITAIH